MKSRSRSRSSAQLSSTVRMISIMDEASFALEMAATPMNRLRDDSPLRKVRKKGAEGERGSHFAYLLTFPLLIIAPPFPCSLICTTAVQPESKHHPFKTQFLYILHRKIVSGLHGFWLFLISQKGS